MADITPPGYSEADVEQHALGRAVSTTDSDARSAFQHDVDRILYSAEFRALGGKTQVISSDQRGNNHNRLTHSLKVAQIGRRLTVLLGERARSAHGAEHTPDVDLVEAACLLHDIGHPVFGHIGEREITRALDHAETPGATHHPDGFQANAQNLRIATWLSVRDDRKPRGLHLTRATLDAAVKYPWHRGTAGYAAEHWGCYGTEDSALLWIQDAQPIADPPSAKAAAPIRPIEEQIMDWADEVTYACHDVEDFYRAGLIPLDRILDLPTPDPRLKGPRPLEYDTEQFVDYLEARAARSKGDFNRELVLDQLRSVQNIVNRMYPYESTRAGRGRTASATSSLLNYFLGPQVQVAPAPSAVDGKTLTRYEAVLEVPPETRAICKLLKDLIFCYVIDRPGLATQQTGQRKIVRDLIDWYAAEPERLLPAGRLEEWREHRDGWRAAADHVSSLAEADAVLLHRRMSGVDYGQVHDH